jgi:hypothetical protein
MIPRRIVMVLVSLACLISAGAADEVKTLGGKNLTGTVSAVGESGIDIKTADGVQKVPLAQVLAVDVRPVKDPGVKYTEVRLLDDTVLRAGKVAYPGKDVQVTLLSGGTMNVPLSAVVSVVQDPQNGQLREQWDKVFKDRVKRDRVVLLRDGELNTLSGTFGEVLPKEGKIQFKIEGVKDLELPLDGLHGLFFYRTDIIQEQPICKMFDTTGNAVTALKVAFDGKQYAVTTTFGAKLTLKADAVARLDFNMGKLTYLSDVEPMKVVERSGAGLITKYRKDTNLDGEPIILEKQYAKGLSMHAHTELEYSLGARYKEFKALAGVDVRVGAESQAVLKIYCDGVLQFEKTITAKAVQPIGLSVKDVQTLKIVVASRNFLDLHDHVTLADARVSQ